MKSTTLAALRLNRARVFVIVSSVICLGLGACAAERPQSTFTKGLDTGITASDGGGTRALGNNPKVGVSTSVAPR